MKWIVAAFLLAFAAGSPAMAAIITRSFAIDASGFGPGATYPDVAGTVTITLDTGASIDRGRDGLAISGYTLPLVPTDYAYSAAGDLLTIGFNARVAAAGATTCTLDAGQSCIRIRQISGVPTGIDLSYNDAGTVRRGTLAITPQAGAVPEPSTWAMLVVGFLIIGTTVRRRPVAGTPIARA